MKKTKLIAVLEPSESQRTKGAEVVFLRRDDDGNLFEILACTCHESWEQWGQTTDVLADNVGDVTAWRITSTEASQRSIAREALRERGFYTDNLWHVDDVKCRYEGCDDATAQYILDQALTNSATMEQIHFAINTAIEANKEDLENEATYEVFDILRKEYLKSEVISGEFIHSVMISNTFTQEQVRKGVQMFLDWDESPEKFELEQGESSWTTKPINK